MRATTRTNSAQFLQRARLLLGLLAVISSRGVAQVDYPRAPMVYQPVTPYRQSTSWWSSLFSGDKTLYPAASDPRIPAAGRAVSTKPHPAVARIIVPERKSAALGSGTLIAKTARHGYVITNWHVVREARHGALVVFADGTQAQGKILRTDKDWDLALIQIPTPAIEPLSISSSQPKQGEQLWIAGYGSGEFLLQAGLCSQYLAPYPEWPLDLVEVGAAARQGDSGGPILNARGELAGVLFGQGDGYTMGAYGGRVLQFLAQIPDTDSPTPTTIAQLATARPPFAPALTIAASPPSSGALIHVSSSLVSMPADASPEQRYWQPERRRVPRPQESMPSLKAPPSEAFIANHKQPPTAASAGNPVEKPAPLAAYSLPRVTPLSPKIASRVETENLTNPKLDTYSAPTTGYGIRSGPNPAPQVSLTANPSAAPPLTWEDFAGRTILDQAVTGLWFVGGACLLFKICGWLTKSGSGATPLKKGAAKKATIKKPAPKSAPARVKRNDLYTDDDEDDEDEDDEDEE